MGCRQKVHLGSLVALGLLFLFSFVQAAVVVGQGASKIVGNTQEIHFPMKSPVEFTSFRLNNPPRLVVDIPNAQQQGKSRVQNLSGQYLKQVRTGTQQGTDLRIVFDLKQSIPATTSLVKTSEGYELVVALGSTEPPSTSTTRELVYAQEDVKVAKSVPKETVTIVIDPGHGGKDPGAVGAFSHEKKIVLNIAKKLQASLNKEKGYKAILTRNNDTFIPLRERILFARRQNADMFISIHADAGSKTASGSSVYILSTKGASSEAARLLAKRENQSDLVGGVKLSDKDEEVASMLLDLSQDATIESSTALATHILKNLAKLNRLHKKSVERAGFAVLKSPDIPSVLVETAFISNPSEEKKLNDQKYAQRMADSIKEGVKQYFKERPATTLQVSTKTVKKQTQVASSGNSQQVLQTVTVSNAQESAGSSYDVAPPPLKLESVSVRGPKESRPSSVQENNSSHVDVREAKASTTKSSFKHTRSQSGETLADIAKRSQVSLSALKKINGLPNNQLRVPTGTVLRLP